MTENVGPPQVLFRPRVPRPGAWATGGSAFLVVILATSSSLGSTVVPAKTISAPFHGVVSSATARGASGCSTTASTPLPWRFSLSTGIGSELERGRATNACPHTYGGSHPFSQANTYGGFSAALNLGKPRPGTTQLIATLGGRLNISTVVSDAGSFACGKGLFSIVDNNTYEQWNYRSGPSGGYYANSFTHYSENYNGVWYNSTTSNGVPPSPFHLNNTTYRAHVYSTEKFGFCEAVVTSFYDAYALVYDQTTGNYTNATGTTWPVFGYVEEYLHNDTDFGYDRSSTWDGPSGKWTNSSGPYSVNASGFLTSNYTFPQAMSSSWYNNSLFVPSPQNTYVNSTVVNFGGDTAWFNQTFAATDHYYLLVFFQIDQTAWTFDYGYNNNGWLNAYAGYTGNAATSGNGVRVVSIQER
jgi:hypothetical protein